MSEDILAEFEEILDRAETEDAESGQSPWQRSAQDDLVFVPRIEVLIEMMSKPLSIDEKSQSGKLAKTLDAWIAYELRRSLLDPAEVWPRNRAPRVWSREMEAVETKLQRLADWLSDQDEAADGAASARESRGDLVALHDADARLANYNASARREYAKRSRSYESRRGRFERGEQQSEPKKPATPELRTDRVPVKAELALGLRSAVNTALSSVNGRNNANILGQFYIKQVDVVVGSFDRGPDILVSGKTMWSSFGNNAKNRYEETLGEAANLRNRYPLAAMGYAYVLNDAVLEKQGAYAKLQDLLLRTRKPYGPYDATLLLLATWDEGSRTLQLRDPLQHEQTVETSYARDVDLSAQTFFTDLLNTVIANTPEGQHEQMRELKLGTPPGGAPDLVAEAEAAAAATKYGSADEDDEVDE